MISELVFYDCFFKRSVCFQQSPEYYRHMLSVSRHFDSSLSSFFKVPVTCLYVILLIFPVINITLINVI